jgi:hypothetical protein
MGAAFRLFVAAAPQLDCRSYWGGHRCHWAWVGRKRTRTCRAQREGGTRRRNARRETWEANANVQGSTRMRDAGRGTRDAERGIAGCSNCESCSCLAFPFCLLGCAASRPWPALRAGAARAAAWTRRALASRWVGRRAVRALEGAHHVAYLSRYLGSAAAIAAGIAAH